MVRNTIVSNKNVSQITGFMSVVLILIILLSYKANISGDEIPFILISFLSAGQISKTILFGWFRLHEQIFWIFIFVWLGLAPLVQQLSGVKPLPFEVEKNDYTNAGWLVLISILIYSFLVEMKIGAVDQDKVERKLDPRKVSWFSSLACLISALIVLRIGPEVFLQSREDLSKALFQQGRVDNSQGAILAAFACVPIFVALIAIQLLRRQVQDAKFERISKVVLVLNLYINNPISQGRFWFCTVWGSYLLVKYWGRSRAISYIPILSITFILIIFPISDIFRYSQVAPTFRLSSPLTFLQSKGDFDSFEQIAWGVKFVDETGRKNGEQILGALTFAIPRGVWPEKPRDTGIILGEAANFGNLSLSAPIWIEGYFDGGILLMCTYISLFSIFHARIRTQMNQKPEFIVIFSLYQLVIFRGSLIATMGVSSVLLGSVFFLKKFSRSRN